MDEGLRELVSQIDSMREQLHQGFKNAMSSEQLLALSQKLDTLILEYLQIQKKCKSSER